MPEDRRCGTCKSWMRGGIGVGRGGGWCYRWSVPKTPGNKITDEQNDCWEPSRAYIHKREGAKE